MDKHDLVLDLVGHPENYSAEEIREILSDPETHAIYNLLCKAASAGCEAPHNDVDRQWQQFERSHIRKPRRRFHLSGRAASAAACAATSLVAIAVGIAVTSSRGRHRADRQAESITPKTSPAHIPAFAADTTDTVVVTKDSIPPLSEPILFEDATLQSIMETIGKAYRVEIVFRNKAAASLHLYYKLDPALSLDEVIGQLNTFEQISISRNENTISID